METHIIPPKSARHTYLLWVSSFLLIFNVYHTQLVSFFVPVNSVINFIIQAIALVLLIIYFIVDKRLALYRVVIQPVDWLLILCLLVIIVTTKNYVDNLTYIIRFATLVLLVILMKYDSKMSQVLLYCILAAGIIHIIATIWFYYDVDFYLKNIYPAFEPNQQKHLHAHVVFNHHAPGLSGNYSQNGIYISIAACASFALFFTKSRKALWLKIVLFAASLFALFLTGKRGVLLFSVFAMLLTYIICKKGALSNKLITVLLILSGALLIMYALSFYVEGIAASFDRFFSMFGNNNDNYDVSNGRFKLYSIAWDFFKGSPVFGIGWREFNKEVTSFYNQDSELRDTHNVFLQLLCETGVVGFIVFMVLFIFSVILTVRLIVRTLKSGEDVRGKEIQVFSLCYQIFFLAYCVTGNPLYDLETVYVYILSIGFAAGIHFRRQERPVLKSRTASKYIK